MVTQILLVAAVILLVFLVILVVRGRGVRPRDIEDAVSSTWTKLGLEEKIGLLTAHTQDIRDCHRSIEQMLRVPKERAALGELSLETILSDQLSPDMFGIRKSVLDGKVPDAHIRSTVGLICIDSKFPLDNYRSMVETEDSRERDGFKTNFRRDVRNHLNKIAQDYVCPDKGSAEFAFAYIPSEGVYYFLVNEEFEMLRDYARKGVQVVSPLTLCHKIELIKAGVHAKRLSQEAENVRNDLNMIAQRFSQIDALWRVFYDTHLRNAGERAEELDREYKKLRDEFDRISRMSKE
jgi:DNA recombination protein RmuC